LSYDRAIGQLKNGPSRPTLYKLTMPSKFVGRGTNDYLEYFCNTAQIPSVRYNHIVVGGHTHMGVTRLQPSLPVWTNPLTVSIIENSDFETYTAFKDWFDQTGTGIDQQGNRSVKLKYFKEITGDIELEKLEFPDSVNAGFGGGQLKKVLKVKFLDCYIKSIGPIALSTEQRDSYLTFNVEFNYQSYTTEQ